MYKSNLPADLNKEEMRPVAHQHMAMLTSAGIPPAPALAIAAQVCALIYSGEFDRALEVAFEALASASIQADD
jgi:hypothetical protein